MIKTLYKTFQHWSENGSVYVISDPHFGDSDMNWRINIIDKFEGTNESRLLDLPEAQKHIANYIAWYIVEQINKVCHKNDTLIILGDIGSISYIPHLKAGYRVLIKGNHDLGNSNYQRVYDKLQCTAPCPPDHCGDCKDCGRYDVLTEDNYLFDEVYGGPLFIAKNIVLSHEPIQGINDIAFNIHGHEHYDKSNEWLDYLAGIKVSDCYLNTCCELNAFVPMNLNEIIKDAGLSSKINIHKATIRKAVQRKNEAT